MCKKNILTIAAVAILALAIGQVQAETVTVPNSDFELIYKPGSTTITGELSPAGGSWTQGVGPDCPIGLEAGLEVGEYEFSDTSTGTVADIPGWLGYDRDGWIALGGTYGRNQTTGNLQGSVANQSNHTPGGLNCYLANGGGWSNPAGGLIVSDASLGNILSNSTYTLSMFVKARDGGADPIVLELLVDGVVVTPSFSVSPVLTGDWQEFTRTYDVADLTSYVGQALTIVLGVGRNSSGDQSHFDDVSLSYYVALPPGQATNPNPADGATNVCPKVVLSWTPGPFVGALSPKHKVFLSENFDDVNDGVGSVTQDPNRYPATGTLSLDFGKTYYWKVDEANSITGWDEGDIWQFTTEPIAYPIAGDKITAATASSSMAAGEGPENTINGSGLNANDLHSIEATNMWLSSSHQPGEAWIKYEFDKVYKLHEMWVWNYNSESEPFLGYGLKDVTIEYSENGTDYTTLGTTHEFARALGEPDYEHNTEVYFGVAAKYVRLTANSNWVGIFDKYGLSEVRFFYIPVRAREPSPEDGTTGVWPDVVLSWIPGRDADTHNLYLSTDEQAVTQGTISPSSIPAADGCRASYGPLSLEFGKTYYWRIDEVNDADTWKGDTWSFTTRKVYYVDADGPADFDNIQAAIDEANGGDVIIVYPGRYCENINFSGKAIAVTSTNPDDPNIVEGTIIDANGVGSVVTFANGEGPDSVLAGFTITGGYGTADTSIANFIYWGAGIYCNNASPTVKDNVIIGNYGPIKMEGDDPENWQLGYGGGIGCLQSSAIITRNIIKGNEAYAGAGIMVYVGDGRITDNLIYDNSAEIGGGVILLVGGQLINNTVVSNHATIAGNVYGGGEFLIVNNIISSGNAVEGGGIYTENPDQYVIAYNNVWDNTGGNYREVSDQTGLNGNISEAPLFVNPAGNDYHLQVDSPCINAGDPNYIAEPNETDLDGKPRVIGGRIDMGAYEFFNTPPVACIVDGNRIVECEGCWGARVTLDGSCSSDADSTAGTNDDIANFDWYKVDACDPNFEDFLASGEIIDCNLPLGEHIIVLEVIDKADAFDTNEVTIIVQDSTPPDFMLSVTPTVLWPANHKMVLIRPSWTASDICDESPEVLLVSITMNEGDGHTNDDIQIGDDGSIYLRAERSGSGSGRIYTITYQAVDDSGNAAVASATVTVPHDQR